MVRLRLEIAGTVQGVGFRPCVHRLAAELGLSGWVRNSLGGVEIEIEGSREMVGRFPGQLEAQLPPHASIASSLQREIPAQGSRGFRIEPSANAAASAGPVELLPDLATCDACLAEVFDPSDRRYAYPFTNCTHCGPRFSILLGMPYDRANTTMRGFAMCDACHAEYTSPQDRRFHAQPNACPDCGPQLRWLDRSGEPVAERADALELAAAAIGRGEVVAVKGIGGFHLLADARNPDAIGLLRQRKRRTSKPFALMVPSLESARDELEISAADAAWLSSAAAPIVIVRRKPTCQLPASLAPGNPELGILLAYSPLHHLLMARLGFAVIATSGNRGDEPICTGSAEAVTRLGGIADGFLVHDRPIARPVDDSVLRQVAGRELLLRRSRGFSPAPIPVRDIATCVLAYGGDLKGTIAVADRGQVVLSQHLGDLASPESRHAFERHLADFPGLCRAAPAAIACDRHPSYHSHQFAAASKPPATVVQVQHHHAHAVACAAENGIGATEEFLGVAWDGTGYGDDGTVWGGEFLRCRGGGFQRCAWLRPFPLPGGENAVRDPRFAALGCLHAAGIPVESTPLVGQLSAEERAVAKRLIDSGLNTPRCSSAGRIFDAVSALCGLSCHRNDFEGQAAMALEIAASSDQSLLPYPVEITAQGEIDWTPLLRSVVADLGGPGTDPARISRRFHLALAELIGQVAVASGCRTIALTGGCFQNTLLLELSIARLEATGLRPIWHRRVPPNDGGLAFGQAVVASRLLAMQTD